MREKDELSFRDVWDIYCILLLLLLLLSHFSCVRLCATPYTAAHQAPPSLGFSRQEHWSGLPFPSPMHESEKWKWSHSVMSDLQWPHGLQPSKAPPSMGFSRQEYWSGVPLPSPYPIKFVQRANSHLSEVKSRLQRCANHQFIKECKVEQKANGEDKE